MEDNKILDANLQAETFLSAQDIIARLQSHGIYQVYEKSDGAIKIDGTSALEAKVFTDKSNNWVSSVSVAWLSAYTLIPAVVFKMLFLFVGLDGAIIMAICVMIGQGIANLILSDKKQQLQDKLDSAIS